MNGTITEYTEEKKTDINKQDQPSWAESAKEDLEEFIELQGIYIRQ